MTQLESLTDFVTLNMPPRAMLSFQSSMDDCELIPSPKAQGNGQKRIGVLRYSAVLSWDDFPYRACAPSRLYALVLAWVADMTNDLHNELKLPPPTVDPEFIDDKTAMIQITVPVADEINLRQAENGVIPHRGQQWNVVYPEFWVAEEVEIITSKGTD